MKAKMPGVLVLCWLCWVSGVTPEICAMPVPSSEDTGGSEALEDGDAVARKLAEHCGVEVSAAEARRVLGKEAAVYADPRVAFVGGGYYGSVQPNQYSSFFGNVESFLVELVEFFLFLAMLSYIVGYEEWLPWEKDKE